MMKVIYNKETKSFSVRSLNEVGGKINVIFNDGSNFSTSGSYSGRLTDVDSIEVKGSIKYDNLEFNTGTFKGSCEIGNIKCNDLVVNGSINSQSIKSNNVGICFTGSCYIGVLEVTGDLCINASDTLKFLHKDDSLRIGKLVCKNAKLTGNITIDNLVSSGKITKDDGVNIK